MDEKWGIRVKSTGVLDDFPCSLDGLVQVLKLSFFSLVMLPVCSFGLDARTDMIIRKAFSDESQCVSEVSTGVIVLLIAVSGKILAHPPQKGGEGKGHQAEWRKKRRRLQGFGFAASSQPR